MRTALFRAFMYMLEIVAQGYCKISVLKNLAKFLENICVSRSRSQIFFKICSSRCSCNIIKKRLQHRCFPVNFGKFFKTAFYSTSTNGFF